MVAPHRPARPERIVVKEARRCPRPRPVRRMCVVCGAVLRDDHCAGELVCDSHPRDGYEPRHDPLLDSRVLALLYAAKGETLNLCRALGAYPNKSNQDAVQDAVQRLNRTRFVRIVGVPGWGYRLAVAGRQGGRR